MIKHKTRGFLKFLKKHLKIIIISCLAAGFVGVGALALWISTFEIPDLSSFETRTVAQSTKIYDRTGQIILFDINQDIKRQVIPFENISQNIKNAAIAIEDAEFYQHHGIRITSIIRAFLSHLVGGTGGSGSTITQQVIKNSLLTSEVTISRKLKEWFLAIKLDASMPKDQILSIYLNEIPYGGSIYGVEEASRTFFGKKASDVTLAEAAYLAAIPNAPTYYSPYGNNKDKLDNRKNLVLSRMLVNKLITQAEYDNAKKEVVTFTPQQKINIRAPHFVTYIRQYLEDKYGEKMVNEGGLKVTTTLDYSLQEKAEALVKQYALQNKINFGAENASVVAIDPKTGQILIMVGSRDYFDKEINGAFNVAIAHRQPGSTFKPIVYATAFNKGYTPDTVVFDLPTQFSSACDAYSKPLSPTASTSDCYMPDDYDNKFEGPMKLRDALAQSRNIPAVKMLYLAGIQDSLDTAQNMGVTSLTNVNQYGLTLVLGGGEVSPLEMTGAYGVFANEGVRNPTVGILKIEDADGKILEQFTPAPQTVLPTNTTDQISDILSDNVARAPAYGLNSPLYVADRQVAVKTGTTNDSRDAWIIGYAPNIVLGAWAGNNDNSPMVKKTAGLIVSPMWRAVMDEILKTLPVEYFNDPQPVDQNLKPVLRGIWLGNESYTIDKISQRLATDLTPTETKQEVFVPNVHEILHWVDKNNPTGPVPTNPSDDPQYDRWETSVQDWLKTQYIAQPVKPTTYDNVHTLQNSPKLKIINLDSNQIYSKTSKTAIYVTNSSIYPLSKVDFYINNEYAGTGKTTPFYFILNPASIKAISTTNTLKVVGVDSVFNKGEAEMTFKVSE